MLFAVFDNYGLTRSTYVVPDILLKVVHLTVMLRLLLLKIIVIYFNRLHVEPFGNIQIDLILPVKLSQSRKTEENGVQSNRWVYHQCKIAQIFNLIAIYIKNRIPTKWYEFYDYTYRGYLSYIELAYTHFPAMSRLNLWVRPNIKGSPGISEMLSHPMKWRYSILC